MQRPTCSRLNLNEPSEPRENIYDKLRDEPHMNKLQFPGDKEPAPFLMENFEEIKTNPVCSGRNEVKVYRYLPNGRRVAVKRIIVQSKQTSDDESAAKVKSLLREIEIGKKMSEGPNIINTYGMGLYEGSVWICMELMDMSLREFCRIHHEKMEPGERLNENILGYILVKIIDGLAYLQNREVIHRDVKPENILLSASGEVKLCDFGEARELENSFASTHDVGTVSYWPPERMNLVKSSVKPGRNHKKYGVEQDIWAVGIISLESILGHLPYLEETEERKNIVNVFDLQDKIASFVKNINKNISQYVTEKGPEDLEGRLRFKNFVKICLQPYETRPKNYYQLIKSDFYLYHQHKRSKSDFKKYVFMHRKFFESKLLNEYQEENLSNANMDLQQNNARASEIE